MGQLSLYTAFHANLFYSSIPKEEEGVVIDRCYWPLLEIVRDLGVPIGLELSGYTLERIAAVDPLLLDTLRRLWAEKKIEILGSGFTQAIFPLIPVDANRENLRHGNAVYERLLGKMPTVAYVNEQTYARGLVDLYREAGYEAILMDWNNPAKYNRYDEEFQFRPQRVQGASGSTLRILWNHSISFQKFQRYVGGELSLDEELAYLHEKQSRDGNRAFLLYGSDLEIFDHSPGKRPESENDGKAFARIREIFARLQKEPGVELMTPSAVLNVFPEGKIVTLESPEYPIPCKKQDKYNLTRWAVTGHEDTIQNTGTMRLHRALRDLTYFVEHGELQKEAAAVQALTRDLAFLWSSDFRTAATPAKLRLFHRRAGELRARIRALRALAANSLFADPEAAVVLVNPSQTPWERDLVAFCARFTPGMFAAFPRFLLDGEEVLTQFEDVEWYRDGSLRSATVLCEPTIPAKGMVTGRFQPGGEHQGSEPPFTKTVEVATEAVRLTLHERKGGSIRALQFPQVADKPLVGHIPHGFYEDISLSPDFFTADVVLTTREGKQLTDLAPAESTAADDPRRYPIRVPIRVTVPTEFGQCEKEYFVSRHSPRVDCRFQLLLNRVEPRSLHVGIVAFLPEAFDRSSLQYLTVNGGEAAEAFALAGHTIKQDEPVRMLVSAKHCLGETEGWLSIADCEKSFSILSEKELLYSVPLLHYEETEPHGFFLRVIPTVAESDDVPGPTLWGPMEKRLTFTGSRGSFDGAERKRLGRLSRGLIVVTRPPRAPHR